MTSTPCWSDHQTGKRRAETSTKHPRRSQRSGAGGQWRAGPGWHGWVTTCYRCPSGQMWGRRADHWAATRESRLLAVRAVLKEVTASSGSGWRQSRGQARGQSASVVGGRAHTAHAAEGRSVSYGRSGSARRGPPPDTLPTATRGHVIWTHAHAAGQSSEKETAKRLRKLIQRNRDPFVNGARAHYAGPLLSEPRPKKPRRYGVAPSRRVTRVVCRTLPGSGRAVHRRRGTWGTAQLFQQKKDMTIKT